MAAKLRSDTDGQSVVEFLLMMPVLVGMIWMLVKVNSTVQMSIVNQQYARAQALFLTYHSPNFPELRFGLNREDTDLFEMGVSDNLAAGGNEQYVPQASVGKIFRPGAEEGSDDEKEEPNLRGRVRVRNTVALCSGFKSLLQESTALTFCRGP